MITLAGLTLPADLQWTDEFNYQPVAEAVTVAASGSQWIETSTRQAGRPITLAGGKKVWVYRDLIVQLKSLADTPMAMVLHYHGVDYDVRFRYSEGAYTATPVHAMQPPGAGDPYFLTLRLRTI